MTKEKEPAHSPLGPSAADRWINCPGSVAATAGIVDEGSEYAAEGNFAHDILELARNEKKPAKDYMGNVSECGRFEVDREMVDAVQSALDYLNVYAGYEYDLNEHRVRYDAWVDSGFGTLDAAFLDDGLCIVADFKYGKGVQVWAEDNSQLKLYALGIFQEFGDMFDIERFRLAVMQPRIGHLDEWEIDIDDLLEWAEKIVEPAAEMALGEDAPIRPGFWCDKNFCKIRATCQARADWVKDQLIDEIGDVRNPAEMDNEQLAQVLDLVPIIKKWCAAVEEKGLSLVSQGETLVGADGLPYKLVEGRGTRKWKSDEQAEKAMRNNKLKVGEIFTRKLISPAQAEKLLGKDHGILKKYVEKSRGKPVLVTGSDPRPAMAPADRDEMEDLGDE